MFVCCEETKSQLPSALITGLCSSGPAHYYQAQQNSIFYRISWLQGIVCIDSGVYVQVVVVLCWVVDLLFNFFRPKTELNSTALFPVGAL